MRQNRLLKKIRIHPINKNEDMLEHKVRLCSGSRRSNALQNQGQKTLS